MHTAILIGLIGMYVPNATHVRITNPTSHVIALDVNGESIVLAPSQTWDTAGAVRIESEEPLDVRALQQSVHATATVPVLDSRDALDAGFVSLTSDVAWTRAIGIINPQDVEVVVTIANASIAVPANGTHYLHDVTATSFSASKPVLVFAEETNVASGARVITRARSLAFSSKRRSVRVGPIPIVVPEKHTVTLTPSKDATLFEISNGALANGSGIHLFAGMTATNSRRRALLQFDIPSQIPAGSRVTSVSLAMQVSLFASGAETMRLHGVTTSWGEGSSNAGDARDGGGTTSQTGDATWIHATFNNRRWTNAGGDFVSQADASASVAFTGANWTSNAALVARVQAWVDQPANNFGWILLGNESQIRTAKRFDSSEIAGTTKPALTVEFEK